MMETFNIVSANKERDDSITLTIDDPVSGQREFLRALIP